MYESLLSLSSLWETKISRDASQHQQSACVILCFLCSLWETYVVSDECQRERSNPQSLLSPSGLWETKKTLRVHRFFE